MRRETIVTCQSPFHPFAGQEPPNVFEFGLAHQSMPAKPQLRAMTFN
jgi:hypothetical protein